MGLKVYLPLAFVVFLAATTGSDLIARTSIAGEPIAAALREHLYYAGVQIVGTIFLLAPFAAVAWVCSRAEKQARIRSVSAIFAVAMFALLYFYFQGHQDAQHAVLEKKWTAAALSIGLLPFFIGVPVVLASWGAAALAAKFDRRLSD
jgi:amino acid permease